MKKYLDPKTLEIVNQPVNKDGFIYELRKADGSEFLEEYEFHGPALVVSSDIGIESAGYLSKPH